MGWNGLPDSQDLELKIKQTNKKQKWPDYALFVLVTEKSLSLLDLREQEGT